MSTPLLSKLCNSLFSVDFDKLSKICSSFLYVNHDFDKFKKKPFCEHLNKLASIATLSYPEFTYPIEDSDEIYVRLSTLNELRQDCIGLLDKLPEKHEKIIREFLVFTEDAGKPKALPKAEAAIIILRPTEPRLL